MVGVCGGLVVQRKGVICGFFLDWEKERSVLELLFSAADLGGLDAKGRKAEIFTSYTDKLSGVRGDELFLIEACPAALDAV